MSRRSRQRANARPWEQLPDSDSDSPDLDALLAPDGSDEHAERAWAQREHEQQERQPQ